MDALTQEAAEKALNVLFQNPPLKFQRNQISLDAAVFAFKALVKVDKASRLSAGLFKLWSPIPIRTWAGIPKLFVKAVIKATKDPTKYKTSTVGRTVVEPHRRNLQFHLNNPDVMPCPDFR